MEDKSEVKEKGYVPGPDYKEDNKESLIDIEMNEDTELWLIQLPDDQFPDFDGQTVSLNLDGDGHLGSLEGKSGKVYNLVNYPSETNDVTVFLSSPSGPKVAGKISRHVSLVHFPDPNELALENETKNQGPMSSRTSMTTSSHYFSTPSRSQRTPHSQSRSRSTSKRSSRSEVTDASEFSKRTHAEPSRYSNQSAQDSGRGRSDVTVSGSSELSHRKKSKRKTDSEA
ncbi:mediator-associated protein 2-like [Chenopodium quinoa]|uniref:Mediator-associated protein 2 n=1 Tax=Chenopodium quinoa TaxID=63459 RepID=A0A803L3S9_CHEQI|nr:mediator-associated protein 2-like [Chenopodium quinoa]